MTDRRITSTQAQPRVHHAVFAVRPQVFEQASQYLERLGFQLVEHTVDDVGLRVRIDWSGGIELVTPTESHVGGNGSVAEFLALHGDGLFTVAVRVPDAEKASVDAQGAGSAERYRQHRDGPGFALTEIEMAPLFGLPITFLETNLD